MCICGRSTLTPPLCYVTLDRADLGPVNDSPPSGEKWVVATQSRSNKAGPASAFRDAVGVWQGGMGPRALLLQHFQGSLAGVTRLLGPSFSSADKIVIRPIPIQRQEPVCFPLENTYELDATCGGGSGLDLERGPQRPTMSQLPVCNGNTDGITVFFGAPQGQPHSPGPQIAVVWDGKSLLLQVTAKDAWQKDEEKLG